MQIFSPFGSSHQAELCTALQPAQYMLPLPQLAGRLHGEWWNSQAAGSDTFVIREVTGDNRTIIRTVTAVMGYSSRQSTQIHRKLGFVSSAAHRTICFPCVLQIWILIFLYIAALITVLNVALLNKRIICPDWHAYDCDMKRTRGRNLWRSSTCSVLKAELAVVLKVVYIMHTVYSMIHMTILLQFSTRIVNTFRLLKFVLLLKGSIPLSPYWKG